VVGLGIFLIVIAGLVSLAGSFLFVAAAFRVSLTWGLLVLFVPFAGLVFLVKFWSQAKRGFLISLAGSGLILIAYLVLIVGLASRVKAQSAQLASQAPAGTRQPRVAAPAPAKAPPSPTVSASSAAIRRPLPELPFEDVDPAEVKPRDLARHMGEELQFVAKTGGSVWGKLVSVKAATLTIERRLHGGSVQYDLPLADIRQVRMPD
jgi:hypothetical protein